MNHLKMLAAAFFLIAQTAEAKDYFSAESFYEAARAQERSNPSEAVSLYTTSANKGYIPAQLLLGSFHRSGLMNVEKNCQKSIYWYERASEQGSTDATVALANVYAYPEDKCYAPEKAAPLFKEAANTGNGKAQQGLALLYIQGQGVKRDLVAAYAWLSVSMKNGEYESSLYLRDLVEKALTPTEIEKAKALAKKI